MKPSPPVSACDDPQQQKWLGVDEARQRMIAAVSPVSGHERLAIRQALNHVLAEDIRSSINVPPYENSAMDGYAVLSEDLPQQGSARLLLAGESFAGVPFQGSVSPGQCVRIMTGAMVPEGCDTVIMQEQVSVEGKDVIIQSGHQPGDNVRHIGEDIAAGEIVLAKGKPITPAELGLLASLGIPEVTVYRKLRVAFFSTGDELRAVGEQLQEGQIYDSNRYSLHGMLQQQGVELIDMGIFPDQREAIEEAFRQAANQADVIITSGGVSVGEADFVKETLDKLGKVDFWKIAMKPGKPLAFGFVDNAAFFGLPGNPVSVMATFYQFVLPAMKSMMGMSPATPLTIRVPCSKAIRKQPGRTDFQRGILGYNAQGELVVETIGMQASHILSGMSHANCFVIIPTESGDVQAGELVDVQPFRGIM